MPLAPEPMNHLTRSHAKSCYNPTMHKSRTARNAYMRSYTQANRPEVNLKNRIRRQKKRAWATEQLGGKCVRCASTTNLHFDHIDPEEKGWSIGNILNCSRARLLEELSKCQLLCAKCHKQKTMENHEYQTPARHGSSAMYNNHRCRCDECRLWKRNYDLASKSRRIARLQL